jgi:hypothetical protein
MVLTRTSECSKENTERLVSRALMAPFLLMTAAHARHRCARLFVAAAPYKRKRSRSRGALQPRMRATTFAYPRLGCPHPPSDVLVSGIAAHVEQPRMTARAEPARHANCLKRCGHAQRTAASPPLRGRPVIVLQRPTQPEPTRDRFVALDLRRGGEEVGGCPRRGDSVRDRSVRRTRRSRGVTSVHRTGSSGSSRIP